MMRALPLLKKRQKGSKGFLLVFWLAEKTPLRVNLISKYQYVFPKAARNQILV